MASDNSRTSPEVTANATPDRQPAALGNAQPSSTFASILFPDGTAPQPDNGPSCFRDLNLDGFIDRVIARKSQYDLRPFFWTIASSIETIRFRQDVVGDLEDRTVTAIIERLAISMQRVREMLARAAKLYYDLQKQRYLLEAAGLYCHAVHTATAELAQAPLRSAGLGAFRDYLSGYAASERFETLKRDGAETARGLDAVRYSTTIYGGSFKVRRYEDEADYSAEILQVFAKFREVDAKSYLVDLPDHADLNHVEAKVLEFVSALFPEEFARLAGFASAHGAFQDPVLVRFDREVQFYLSYLAVVDRLREAGLSFCRPAIVETKDIAITDTFDVALAERLTLDDKPVVTNDFRLKGKERIFLISGPNQGGKTTFARTFGQLHILGSLGLPVPGREATLASFDTVFTHFEREEHVGDLRGKLEDEIIRVHDILEHATPRSIVIMNETFGSTTLRDATLLADRVLREIIAKDLLCVCVTFLDELASLDASIVSMVSEVVPDRLTERTFRLVRRPPDGRSYAMALAEKYKLTSASLAERLARAA